MYLPGSLSLSITRGSMQNHPVLLLLLQASTIKRITKIKGDPASWFLGFTFYILVLCMKFFPCAICTACTAGHKQWENEAAFGEIFSLWKEVFLSLLKFYSESFHSEQMPATFIGMALLRVCPSQNTFLLPNYRITRGSLNRCLYFIRH